MKKQILLLTFFVLAILAGTSKSYGQCATDAQRPQANVAYHYMATNTPGTTPIYEWYVTTNPDIKAKDKKVLADGLFTWSGEATADVTITWTAAAIELARTTQLYVALWYSETTADGCTVENTRAIQIAPVNSFLLAISPVDASGATQTATCAAPVLTAVVDHPAAVGADPTTATMAITYGANTITYKITASGVDGSWSPRIQIPALIAPQTYASVQWSTSPNSGFADFSPVATNAAGGTYTATAADVAVTVAGSDYYVRLVINQGSYESLADQTLNVAVDGYLAANHTVSDIDDSGNCTEATAFFRNADARIDKRPDLVPGDLPFMLKNP